ncbi:hypothetical protein OG331_50545 [Streptomyces sp. NBC_01017]|uniref:hypothetical protein n=1 Tax=Streptomyces sp. NBC_01017 TaxID=2903721 RepID=UPI00386A8912|nr:hypothetical protein OG331_01430 [Streptomyces sp. NBC_01017]WSV35179.1 hypothetical protein OG331_50545 [Streptomyces sp. NBC_01017]
MIFERGRREEEQGRGSGISIGGSNNAPNQNVVGQNISNVYQSASVQGAVDIEIVRGLLTSFRTDVEQNETGLANAAVLLAMTDSVDTSLGATDPQAQAGALRGVAQALPALVAGTAVQQGGQALANALSSWVS